MIKVGLVGSHRNVVEFGEVRFEARLLSTRSSRSIDSAERRQNPHSAGQKCRIEFRAGVLSVRPRRIVQFGEFRFDPVAPLLMHGSRSLDLSSMALEIFAVLVKNAGRVVGKDDLLNIVWPDAVVEEGNLAVHIFALRKAFGEDASPARYIETIPKRGYRFAAPVYPLAETAKARGGK